MDKIIKVVTQVVKSFVKEGIEFESTDSGNSDSYEYIDVEGHDITVGDDNNREQWEVSLENIKSEESNLIKILTNSLGEPTKNIYDNKVYNWKTGKVTVVYSKDSIEFYQDYDKK
jgi:hypothetical protein